jgi:hypothetical protein
MEKQKKRELKKKKKITRKWKRKSIEKAKREWRSPRSNCGPQVMNTTA